MLRDAFEPAEKKGSHFKNVLPRLRLKGEIALKRSRGYEFLAARIFKMDIDALG